MSSAPSVVESVGVLAYLPGIGLEALDAVAALQTRGAALALMLFFFQEGRAITQVLGREVVSIEIIRMLIGSIGLVLSVPVATWLAVLVADTGRLESHHGHGHGVDGAGLGAEPERGPRGEDFGPTARSAAEL